MTEYPQAVKKCARRLHLLRFIERVREKAPPWALAPRPGFGTLAGVTRQHPAGGGAFPAGPWTFAYRSLLALCLLPVPALAQAEDGGQVPSRTPQVRVDCPELDEEARAAVEARQMSELLSQGVESGTLLLVCSPDRVSGIWQEEGVTLDSRFLSRNEGESAVELLHWLASVLLELRGQRDAPLPAARSDATQLAVAGSGQVAVAATGPVEAADSPAVSSASPPGDVGQGPEGAPRGVPSRASEPSEGRWTLALGAAYAHFGTEIAGALGPRFAVSYRVLPGLHVVTGIALGFGLGSSAGIGVIETAAAVGASYDIMPFVTVTLAPRLVLTNFSRPPEVTGSTASVVAGGFLLSARAKVPLHPLRPYLDLGVEASTPIRRATLDGASVLTVPAWQTVLALGIELSL
jgi:hypothetical protein